VSWVLARRISSKAFAVIFILLVERYVDLPDVRQGVRVKPPTFLDRQE
jgi:hypothetical protein